MSALINIICLVFCKYIFGPIRNIVCFANNMFHSIFVSYGSCNINAHFIRKSFSNTGKNNDLMWFSVLLMYSQLFHMVPSKISVFLHVTHFCIIYWIFQQVCVCVYVISNFFCLLKLNLLFFYFVLMYNRSCAGHSCESE